MRARLFTALAAAVSLLLVLSNATSASSAASATTVSSGTVPSVPAGLTATRGNTQVVLNWNANPAADNVDTYQVYDASSGNTEPAVNLNIPSSQTTYTVTGLTGGTAYTFRISAHNSVGYGNWTSQVSATPTSGVAAPVNTSAPAVSGVPIVGNTLSVSNGTWANSPTSYAYQWQDCDSSGASCTNISGATSAGHTLASSDVNHTMRAVVTATSSGGSTAATPPQTAVVTDGGAVPVNTATPAITGVPIVGNSLAMSNGTWTNSPTSYTYQWQDCDATGRSCSTISGATSNTYTVRSADMQSSIRAVVAATNAGGSTSASGITGPQPMMLSRIAYGSYTCGAGTCSSPSISATTEANRYQMIDFQSTNAAAADTLRGINPNLKTLSYVDTPYPTNLGGGTNCVAWATVNANNGWFALDTTGARIQNRSYAGSYLVDPNNGTQAGTYANACASGEISTDHLGGFSGTFQDDASSGFFGNCAINPGCGLTPITINKYQTYAAYSTAIPNLFSYVGARLRAASPSLLSVANTAASDDQGVWQAVMNGSDGGMIESWADGGSGTAQQDGDWPAKLSEASYNMTNNKYLMVVDHSTTEGGNGYGLTSLLLAANGRASFTAGQGTGCTVYVNCEQYWTTLFGLGLRLGPATGTYTTSTLGGQTVYQRQFANGIVLVNPTQSATSSFTIPGSSTYYGSNCTGTGGTCTSVTSTTTLTLGTDGGAILLKR